MEVVSAAASIAGIITLVFQSIDGLHKFKELFSDASLASKTISRLLEDINSLIQVLESVRDILEQFEAQKKEKNFASLDIKLADCSKDIHIWLSAARILRPSAEHGGRAWLKKFRLAVNRDAIQTIRDEISRHRQIISLSLSVLGRNIDLDTSEQVYRLADSASQSLSNYNAQEAALRRIENCSRASLHYSTHSITSLDIIRNKLSKLEARVNSTNPPENASSGEKEPDSINAQSQGASTGIGSNTDALACLYTSSEGRPLASQISEQVIKDGRSFSVPPNSISYKSSFLHASFSAAPSNSASAQFTEPSQTHFNTSAIHDVLQQSLLEAYPPCVANYISLMNLLRLCSNHLELLRHSETVHPHIRRYEKQEEEHTKFTTPSSAPISDQIKGLQHAMKALRYQCTQAGYSLSIIDKVLLPAAITHHEFPVSAEVVNSDDEDWKDVSEGIPPI